MLTTLFLVLVLFGALALAYINASGRAWGLAVAVALALSWYAHALPLALNLLFTVLFIAFALALAVPGLRRKLISDGVLAAFRKLMPPMSPTERDALEAGTVWWDGELFSGRPNWQRLLDMPRPALTADEQRFLDNEVETLCGMTTDWETTNVYKDLPPHVWQYIKDHGFLGMIIPKEYGGLGFSAYAHSQVITRLSTRCGTTAVTVMVPNSLGPGELLLHYGTEEQKRYYLPRLAKGLEVPCFALTSPSAGSDAAAIPDYAFVCWGEHEGRRTLGLRVTWDKRYITLGPVATLLGLAFRAYDPEKLFGDKEDLGITCALIPATHPGVEIGRRHMPLNAVFQNGPNSGKDVFIPDGLGDRRPADAGPRLANADGMPGRGPRHFASVVEHGHGDTRRARRRRVCARAHAVQDGDRQVRGHRGGARAHGRQSLHDGRDARGHCGRDRPGREAGRADGDREVPHHRARAPDDQRRHGRDRRQGHLHGTVEFPGRRLHAAPGRDHRRGREHPDAQPHHLRTGRDPLPPVRAEGDQGDARHRFAAGLDRVRRRAVRPPALRHLQLRAHAGHGLDRIAFRRRARRCRARRRGAITSS